MRHNRKVSPKGQPEVAIVRSLRLLVRQARLFVTRNARGITTLAIARRARKMPVVRENRRLAKNRTYLIYFRFGPGARRRKGGNTKGALK
jgi:hypothetical protein